MKPKNKFLTTSLARFIASAVCAAVLAGCARPQPPAIRVTPTSASVVALRSALGSGAEAAAAGPVTVAEPTGWATLRGTFKLGGQAPERSPLTVDKDMQVCAPGGKQV